MSAKVAAYLVQGRNSMTCMTRTGQLTKLRKKNVRTAEKNTSNGTLAKNKAVPGRERSLFASLDAVS
jgi:hypothetical protein